jgi:polyphosphate:AMP phosphotransferase
LFEVAELGRSVSQDAYRKAVPALRNELLQAQFAVRDAGDFAVALVIDGVPGAGRSDVVNLLKGWLDVRELETHAFGAGAPEIGGRPPYWRYWNGLARRGRLGIYFGSWYADALRLRNERELNAAEFRRELARIRAFERTLTDAGTLVVKLWLHLSKQALAQRLETLARERETKGRFDLTYWDWLKAYERNLRNAGLALLATDSEAAPWHRVDSSDGRHRNLVVARILRDSMRNAADAADGGPSVPSPVRLPPADVSLLENLDPNGTHAGYKERMKRHRRCIRRRTWQAFDRDVSTVLVFEGHDAAGKGGAIRRLVKGIDARLVRVHRTAAPSDEEAAHHYLWRFWRQVPEAGRIAIFDRSWYGRILVERIEGLASDAEWMRAYGEINEFEEHLTEHGVLLLKFLLFIDKDDQLRRFEARQRTPHKRHKITEEDWRNREKWDAYQHAYGELVARTSTSHAPWHLVPANDKKHARLMVLHAVSRALRKHLQRGD